MHDIGGDMAPCEDLNDSVFLGTNTQQQRTPPDMSPLLPAKCTSQSHGGSTLLPSSLLSSRKKSNVASNNNSNEHVDSDDDFRLIQGSSASSTKSSLHRNRYFCFEDASLVHQQQKDNELASFGHANSATKSAKKLSSPNLSPIRQDELVKDTASCSASRTKSSLKKQPKAESNADEDVVNMSVAAPNKSIIFMETCVNKNDQVEKTIDDSKNNDAQNVSFSEVIVNHEHQGHYPREEFYVKKLFHEREQNDDTYSNSNQSNAHNHVSAANSRGLQVKSSSSNANTNDNNNNNNMLQDEKQSSFLIPVSSADVSRANSSIFAKQNSINTTASTHAPKGMFVLLGCLKEGVERNNIFEWNLLFHVFDV